MKKSIIAILVIISLCLSGCSKTEPEKEVNTNFEASLDTEKSVDLKLSGFLGNFEALDQVVNEFNEYYPNVTVTYEANGATKLAEYVVNNNVDIFMTADQNIRYPDLVERYVGDYCLDLSSVDLDLSAINEDLLKNCTIDGKLVSIPLGQNVTGMAVNTSLLEKEGLNLPKDYSSFIDTLDQLVAKGYVPIQGSSSIVATYLIDSMVMAKLGSDENLLADIKNSDEEVVSILTEAFDILNTFKEKGYFSDEVNANYPEDNYDGAIMTFLDGEVPFWMCSSENFSGSKKREAKSEHFTAEPFEYSFINVPMMEDGSVVYSEAWYGFSVNKDSANLDYALEFMKFLVRSEVISEMAQIKGIPSVTGKSDDVRYGLFYNPEKVALTYVNTGLIEKYMHDSLKSVAYDFQTGVYPTSDDAAKAFIEKCVAISG